MYMSTLRAITGNERDLAGVSTDLASLTRSLDGLLSASFQNMLADLPVFKFPMPQLDFNLAIPRIDPAIFNMAPLYAGLMGPNSPFMTMAESLTQSYRPQWLEIFESFRKIAGRIYPENWDGVDKPKLGDIEAILLDEGIPLMWVPGPRILAALLDAPDPPARRRIIGQRWKGVLSDCEVALATIDLADLSDERDFAVKCAKALRDGHTEASQALSANLLDSVLRGWYDEAARRTLTKNQFKKSGVKIDLDDYEIREAFTVAPVWHAYAQYRPENGDPVPSKFARHASAHSVSRRQYTRINAVIGLMLVTSLLKFLDTGPDW